MYKYINGEKIIASTYIQDLKIWIVLTGFNTYRLTQREFDEKVR